MRILVTGANGFIGRNMAESLGADCMVRRKCGLKAKQIPWGSGFDSYDVVVNCAGVLGGKGDCTENTEIVRQLLAKCSRQKFVHISTAGVYGHVVNGNEQSPIRPTNEYERSKAEAERLVRGYKNHAILQPQLVYGPHDIHLLSLWKAMQRPMFPLIGSGKNLMHPTYVGDVVSAAKKVLNKTGTYIVAGQRALSLEELYATAAPMLGRTPRVLRVAEQAARALSGIVPGLSKSRIDFFTSTRTFDTAKLHRLGWRPAPLEEGLRQTFEWYRKNGFIAR